MTAKLVYESIRTAGALDKPSRPILIRSTRVDKKLSFLEERFFGGG
jgi:hypothetical protein